MLATHRKEVAHDPLKDGSKYQQHWSSEEKDASYTRKTGSAAPSHQNGCKRKGGDYETHETHRRRVGKAFDGISRVWCLWGQIQLLEELRRDSHGAACLSFTEIESTILFRLNLLVAQGLAVGWEIRHGVQYFQLKALVKTHMNCKR